MDYLLHYGVFTSKVIIYIRWFLWKATEQRFGQTYDQIKASKSIYFPLFYVDVITNPYYNFKHWRN